MKNSHPPFPKTKKTLSRKKCLGFYTLITKENEWLKSWDIRCLQLDRFRCSIFAPFLVGFLCFVGWTENAFFGRFGCFGFAFGGFLGSALLSHLVAVGCRILKILKILKRYWNTHTTVIIYECESRLGTATEKGENEWTKNKAKTRASWNKSDRTCGNWQTCLTKQATRRAPMRYTYSTILQD